MISIARQLAGAKREPVPAQQEHNTGDTEHQRRDVPDRRPHVQKRPGEQHRPDRHRINDQCALADGDEFHRHRAKAHPDEHVGEGREQQPRDRNRWHGKRLPPAERQRGQNERCADAGKAAGEQGRPLLQQQLHQRPVQRPSEGRHAKTEKADRSVALRLIHRLRLAGERRALHL